MIRTKLEADEWCAKNQIRITISVQQLDLNAPTVKQPSIVGYIAAAEAFRRALERAQKKIG